MGVNAKELMHTEWASNVILVDVDWLDKVVFDMTVNFERMLMRRIPKADLSQWVDYIALDGGLRPGRNNIQVLIVYDAGKFILQNCIPSDLKLELNGKAFNDNLGEFSFASFPVETDLVSKEDFMIQCAETLLSEKKVKHLMLVPNMELCSDGLRHVLKDNKGKDVTLFTLEPVVGFHCTQEILTYSLLATLGINSAELDSVH